MAKRLNTSLLAAGEQFLLRAIVERLPPWTTPDGLTMAGLFGAAMAGAGLVLCHWSALFLALVVLGLFLNWFGDSLDGSLARYRGIERPRYGFLLDHSTDLIAQSLIVLGLGLSPYFTLPAALFVLALYLLMSSYTYLRVATEGIHRLSYGGLGATEFRILVACWALFAYWAGPGLIEARFSRFAALDVVIGAMSAAAFVLFVLMVRNDLAQMERLEDAPMSRLPLGRAASTEQSDPAEEKSDLQSAPAR